MTNWWQYSARDLVELYRAREASPVEVLESVIERATTQQPQLGAFVDTYYEEAYASARAAEYLYRDRDPAAGPLAGIPLAIKDETPLAGKRTTSGSRIFAGAVTAHDAPVVQRLRAAGAVFHARTATPEFCCAPFCHSDLWGVTRNPWNHACDPGGSSGGAAAALAAGMTTLADGSDIGGSIRVPASFCGVVGYKPPYGRVPSSLPTALDTYNHQGVLARTVADCALMQNVISGQHSADPSTVRETVRLPDEFAPVAGMRIALSIDLGGFRVDRDVVENTLHVAELLRAQGALVALVDLSWGASEVREALFAHFGALFAAEMAHTIRGHESELTDYATRFIELAANTPPSALMEAVQLEARIYTDLETVFEQFDALLCPTNGAIGFEAGNSYMHVGPEVNGTALESVYDAPLTTPFNLASRCPVLSVPSGIARNGVPTGVQIVGKPYDDPTVFRVGTAIESALEWKIAPLYQRAE